MSIRPLEKLYSYSAEIDLSRQILTTKVDPRTVRAKPLNATIVVFFKFFLPIKSLLLGMKRVFKHSDLQKFCLKLNKYELFSPT